jgi:hypothetical protein
MNREAHEKAAQYHEHAAKAHRRAADYVASNDRLAARDQARNAFDYARYAYDLSARAKQAIEEEVFKSGMHEERWNQDTVADEYVRATVAGS